jgi:hypothetical protein
MWLDVKASQNSSFSRSRVHSAIHMISAFTNWARYNALLISIGIGLRLLCFVVARHTGAGSMTSGNSDSEYYHYWALVRHHSHGDEAILECALAMENNWPITNDVCDPSLHVAVVISLAYFIQYLGPLGVTLFGTAVQIVTACMISSLAASANHRESKAEILASLYWMNPVVIAMSGVSLLGLLLNCLLLCLLLSMMHRNAIIMSAGVALLICWDFKFVSILPIVFLSYLQMSGISSFIWSTVGCIIYFYYGKMNSDDNTMQLYADTHVYYPSVGALWYLNGQVFKTFEAYCAQLLSVQPLLYGFPLAIRLREYPDIAVNYMLDIMQFSSILNHILFFITYFLCSF